MLLVLDSNEHIIAFSASIDPTPRSLLKRILDEYPVHSIRLTRLITDEVRRNLSPESNQLSLDQHFSRMPLADTTRSFISTDFPLGDSFVNSLMISSNLHSE